jgi:DNA-binding response OmpR family regulator
MTETARILVVDDTPVALRLMEALLKRAGFEQLRFAASADEAFLALALDDGSEATVDLVLLDVMMPKIDGIEACRRIKTVTRYEDVPIVMVTTLDSANHLTAAFEAGASDYVTKPVEPVELVARVRAALRHKAALDRRRERERELTVRLEEAERRLGTSSTA